jgi:hypothetical protein
VGAFLLKQVLMRFGSLANPSFSFDLSQCLLDASDVSWSQRSSARPLTFLFVTAIRIVSPSLVGDPGFSRLKDYAAFGRTTLSIT